jgi:hypothetical protein
LSTYSRQNNASSYVLIKDLITEADGAIRGHHKGGDALRDARPFACDNAGKLSALCRVRSGQGNISDPQWRINSQGTTFLQLPPGGWLHLEVHFTNIEGEARELSPRGLSA